MNPITKQPTPIAGYHIPFILNKLIGATEHKLVKGTRRPSARKPNEFDEPPVCPYCNGDKQVWSEEYQEEYDCNGCDGKGFLTFEKQPVVYLLIWRDWHSIECEVQLEHGKVKEAYVTVSEGDYKSGSSIELTLEEQAEAETEWAR